MGKVEFGGIVKEICLAYTPEAAGGRLRDRPRRLRHQPHRRGRGPGDLLLLAKQIGQAGAEAEAGDGDRG